MKDLLKVKKDGTLVIKPIPNPEKVFEELIEVCDQECEDRHVWLCTRHNVKAILDAYGIVVTRAGDYTFIKDLGGTFHPNLEYVSEECSLGVGLSIIRTIMAVNNVDTHYSASYVTSTSFRGLIDEDWVALPDDTDTGIHQTPKNRARWRHSNALRAMEARKELSMSDSV